MNILERREAHAAGYKSITTDIDEGSETHRKILADMTGIDAILIRTGNGRVQLARKRREIKMADQKRRNT